MDLVFNELSFSPLAKSSQEVENNFRDLLKSFAAVRKKYGFKHIRFPLKYAEQPVTETVHFAEWVYAIGNPTLKNLILDLIKRPFVDELEEAELEHYVNGTYEVVDEGCPTNSEPFGLPIANIKGVPSISLSSHEFWKRGAINIINKELDEEIIKVFNICVESEVASREIVEWKDTLMSLTLTKEEELKKFLDYSEYSPVFSKDFLIQLFDWKSENPDKYKYILLLMKDVESHPFTGGMGQTENLKNRGKEASKRITQEDRLSYTLEKNVVSFIACKGHYEFH